jgi:hypothetical protein
VSLPDYGDVADVLETLPQTVDTAARLFRVSHREIAARAGIPSSGLSRLMNGHGITLATAVAILRALDSLAERPPASTSGA